MKELTKRILFIVGMTVVSAVFYARTGWSIQFKDFVTGETELSSLTGDDLFVVIDTPGTTPDSKKITATNVANSILGSGGLGQAIDAVFKSISANRTAGNVGEVDLYETPANGNDFSYIKGVPDAGNAPGFVFGGSATNSEVITLRLGANDNTANFSSNTGVTDLGFSNMNVGTTGKMVGKIPVATKSANYTLGNDSSYEVIGGAIFLSGNVTLQLPPANDTGLSFCAYSTDANMKTIDPDANDGIRNGTATRNANGHYMRSAGNVGDYACLISDAVNGWTVFGKGGTWTDE